MATELGVDAVVSGTLLRAGDQLRVNAQLLEVPAGTILWSRNVQVALGDIFQVQDELAAAIVQSLAIPLSSREKRQLRRDLPASARAYEFYLRANQIGYDPAMLTVAGGLYRSALEEDPNYAPAWARLGRIHRVLAKYGTESVEGVNENLEQAEAAFRRALDLNADLSLAHNLYTNFEVETLGRPLDAMVRLLDRARSSGTDPELFAGLVLACRYCGLLEPSIAADRQARRLDPSIRTSVTYTHFMLGDWERAIATDIDEAHFTTKYAMPLVGRPAEEVIAACLEVEGRALPPIMHLIVKSLRFALERNRDSCIDASRQLIDRQFDPEGVFFGARNVAYVGGAPDFALDTLEQVVERGFYCAPIFRRDPWLDSLRTQARFGEILRRADVLSREAEEAYRRVGGERLLGAVS
jgi:tetratricopeptide (TPR) repeat protein